MLSVKGKLWIAILKWLVWPDSESNLNLQLQRLALSATRPSELSNKCCKLRILVLANFERTWGSRVVAGRRPILDGSGRVRCQPTGPLLDIFLRLVLARVERQPVPDIRHKRFNMAVTSHNPRLRREWRLAALICGPGWRHQPPKHFLSDKSASLPLLMTEPKSMKSSL